MWLSQSGEWKSNDSDDSDFEISDEGKPKKSKRPKIEKKTRPRRRKSILYIERLQKNYFFPISAPENESQKDEADKPTEWSNLPQTVLLRIFGHCVRQAEDFLVLNQLGIIPFLCYFKLFLI